MSDVALLEMIDKSEKTLEQTYLRAKRRSKRIAASKKKAMLRRMASRRLK